MLKQRVITAVILLIVLGGGIVFLPEVGSALLFAAIVGVAAWEWGALSGLRGTASRAMYAVVILATMAAVAWYCQLFSAAVHGQRVQDITALGCLWWAVALLWVKGFPASAVIWRPQPVRLVMGVLTLVPAWLALVYLRLQPHGIIWIFVFVALVAAADIGAYFTGKAWGRSKLLPQVSPGKSWVGFWGGLASATLIAVALWLFLGRGTLVFGSGARGLAAVMAVAVFTALAAVLGDLLESMVKRQQGVKDSGTLLPGHGGVLDRLDSITAAAPVFALCLILAG